MSYRIDGANLILASAAPFGTAATVEVAFFI